MSKILFVIWMLLFPVTTSVAEAILIIARSKANIPERSYPESAYGLAAIIEIFVWVVVGYFIFTE